MSDNLEPQMTELLLKIIGIGAIVVAVGLAIASVVVHFIVKGLGG